MYVHVLCVLVEGGGYHKGLLCPSGNMNVGQCLYGTVRGTSTLPLASRIRPHRHTFTWASFYRHYYSVFTNGF